MKYNSDLLFILLKYKPYKETSNEIHQFCFILLHIPRTVGLLCCLIDFLYREVHWLCIYVSNPRTPTYREGTLYVAKDY
jgi:hypothetical protein